MIRITGLTKNYGQFTAVDDLSLEIGKGETFALLGPNGSGKSTTLRCLLGLSVPTRGEILIDGIDMSRRPKDARRMLSYLPQRVGFPESLTVREVLDFYGRLRRIPPEKIDATLAATHLDFNGFSDKQVSALSGGMLQRLGLAVACLSDAPVLVLDEPMINLDPEGAVRFRDFLLTLKRSGKTIVFSSHMLADVEHLADRVAILVAGCLAAVESVEMLRESLTRQCRMRLTLTSVESRYLEEARRAGAQGLEVEGHSLVVTSPPEHRFVILRALHEAGADLLHFSTEEPSLEDFYLRYLHAHKDEPKEREN